MMIGLPMITGLGKELGKKGTVSDITLYNRKVEDRIINVVEASEKFASLLLSVSMAEVILFHVKPGNLDQRFAEAVLAADAFDKKRGVVFLDGVIEEQVKPLVKGTAADSYEMFTGSIPDLLSFLSGLETEQGPSAPVRIIVDHSFPVKSVGTVVLGVVVSGTVKKHDVLDLNPAGKKVTVKSIQMMDEEVQNAVAGDRVGLALKGVTPEEASRGSVLGDSVVVDRIPASITFNKYSDSISKQVMIMAGTARTEAKQEGSELILGKKIAVWKNQRILVYDPSKKPNVRGHVTI